MIDQSVEYTNALASSDQLNLSPSWTDGIDRQTEFRLRFLVGNLVQTAGIYLHLDQMVISRAIILVQRFYTTSSLKHYPISLIAAASLLLSSKLVSGNPIKPGQLAYVIRYLSLNPQWTIVRPDNPKNILKEGLFDTFDFLKEISSTEMELLAGISFDTNVFLPYSLALSYIQVLGLHQRTKGSEIVKKTWTTINDAIRNCPYLTVVHQPNTIAVTSIIIATTKLNIIISDQGNWWDLFDVSSEDVGHSMTLILEGSSYFQNIDVNSIKLV